MDAIMGNIKFTNNSLTVKHFNINHSPFAYKNSIPPFNKNVY